MKIYQSGDGNRKYVSIKRNNKWLYIPYARYLMEEFLGKPLEKDEEVHHINGDKTDDRLENLEIVQKTHHRRSHALKYPEEIYLNCYECGNKFLLTKEQRERYTQSIRLGTNRRFFCSRKCAGICGRREQLGRNS